jgi:hypothetical protein
MADILAGCELDAAEAEKVEAELKSKSRKKAAKRRSAKQKGDDADAARTHKKHRTLFEEVEDSSGSDGDSEERFAPKRCQTVARGQQKQAACSGKQDGKLHKGGKSGMASRGCETPAKQKERVEAAQEEELAEEDATADGK